MKVRDLLKVDVRDQRDGKRNQILRKALLRKKTNPIPSKTTFSNSWIDVFGGMVGYGSDKSNPIGPDGDL